MFKYETQGTTTYLVYEIKPKDKVDTLSLGMLTNNNIYGVARVLFTQADEKKYLKYNITAKVSAKQFLTGVVNRSRLLGVFSSVLGALISLEEYMIAQDALLNLEQIFVDVSSNEANMICLPIIQGDTEKTIDIKKFFKEIIFSTQFDQAENNSYVTEIINFLNSNPIVSLEEFKALVDRLLVQNKPAARPAQPAAPGPVTPAQSAPGRPQQPPVPPAPRQAAPAAVAPAGQVGKKQKEEKPPKEKKGFSLFGKKKQPKANPAQGQMAQHPEEQIQVGFSVPGMAAQSPASATNAAPSGMAPSVAAAPAPNTSVSNVPAPNTSVPNTPAPPMAAASSPQPQPAAVYQPASFGETTVLGGGASSETTVLGSAAAAKSSPYLLRTKTNEKMEINKEMVRIGKERNYVDFLVTDNPSISRSHAVILSRGGSFCIIDTNSTNHTYVNGKAIPSNVEVPLANGARVRLSNEEFVFYAF